MQSIQLVSHSAMLDGVWSINVTGVSSEGELRKRNKAQLPRDQLLVVTKQTDADCLNVYECWCDGNWV